LEEGFKYLSFRLKPNKYGSADWIWLLTKVEKRINCGAIRWISRGNRLVLIKSIIEAIPVYWHLLVKIPKNILNIINKVIFNYLWKGNIEYLGFHMVSNG
jgi:hypothetical protein